MKALLVLSNGQVFKGRLRGARKTTMGEVIFNTALTGYQEILTDPSYKDQIVTMTYPQIGNYGINPEDMESKKPFAAGMIVKEVSGVASNWRSTETLDGFLERHGVTLLEGLDTRHLVLMLRDAGSLMGIITPEEGADLEGLKRQVAALPGMAGRNLAAEVSTQAPYDWSQVEPSPVAARYKVAAYDYGIKQGILRCMAAQGMEVRVVPFDYPAEKLLADGYHGVFLSNGPGDPEPVRAGVDNVRKLLGQIPIFGICLGHQILALTLGGKSYKLKFGHHGGNHPVKELKTGRVEITSQNHGFTIDGDSLPKGVAVTHVNLNDGTVEGIESLDYPAFSVQYHPEASPGPHDAAYLFGRFAQLMDGFKK